MPAKSRWVPWSASRRNFVGSLSIQGAQRLSRLAIFVVAGARLDTADFAAFAVALALADLARSAFLSFDVAAIRDLTAGGEPSAAIGSRAVGKTFATFAVSFPIAAATWILYGPNAGSTAVILGIGLLPASLSTLWLIPSQVRLQLDSVATVVSLASLATLLLGGIGAMVGSAQSTAIGLALGDLLLCAWVARTVRVPQSWNRQKLISSLREIPSLMVMQVAYVAQFRVGTIALGLTAGAMEVGNYTVAARIAEGMVILSTALTATTYPLIARAQAKGSKTDLSLQFVRAFRISLALSAPLLFLLTISARVWLPLLFPRYPEATESLGYVSLSVVLFFVSAQTTTLLNSLHDDLTASASASLGLVVSTVMSFVLGSSAGAVGVAIARLSGEGVRHLVETAWIVLRYRIASEMLLSWWVVIGALLITAFAIGGIR